MLWWLLALVGCSGQGPSDDSDLVDTARLSSQGTTEGGVGDLPGNETPVGSSTSTTSGSTSTDPSDTAEVDTSAEPITHLSLLPCARGLDCASEGPFLDGTCCAIGDPILPTGHSDAIEVVDVETDGVHILHCTFSGGALTDMEIGELPEFPHPFARCGAIAFGPVTPDGRRSFWTSSSNTWASGAGLRTYAAHPNTPSVRTAEEQAPGVLYGGLDWTGDLLWVAAFDDGVRRYTVADNGAPTLHDTIPLDNATHIALGAAHAYITDGETLRVLAPLDVPVTVAEIPLHRVALDIEVTDNHLYVAMGAAGVRVFDLTDPASPLERDPIPSDGSAVRVDADGSRVAVSHWSHAALYDVETQAMLGSVNLNSTFEQDFGVAISGDSLIVGEWRSVHGFTYAQGNVAPDLWTSGTSILFNEETHFVPIEVHNRGPIDLTITPTVHGSDHVSVNAPDVVASPGETILLELEYDGTVLLPGTELLLESDDPNPAPRIVLRTVSGDLLGEGDRLTADFGFLDPTGEGNVENLVGSVTFVAYFALI